MRRAAPAIAPPDEPPRHVAAVGAGHSRVDPRRRPHRGARAAGKLARPGGYAGLSLGDARREGRARTGACQDARGRCQSGAARRQDLALPIRATGSNRTLLVRGARRSGPGRGRRDCPRGFSMQPKASPASTSTRSWSPLYRDALEALLGRDRGRADAGLAPHARPAPQPRQQRTCPRR